MLILTRKPGQRIRIEPAVGLDPATPIGELFASGPIELTVARVSGHRVRLGIAAPAGLTILRTEIGRTGRPQERADDHANSKRRRATGGV